MPIERREYDGQTFGVRDLSERRRLVVDRQPAINALIGLLQGTARDVASDYLASISRDCTIDDSAILDENVVFEFSYSCREG